VEPHDYGVYKGQIKVFGYQVGDLSSEPLPNALGSRERDV
jgi:hypothetical protein